MSLNIETQIVLPMVLSFYEGYADLELELDDMEIVADQMVDEASDSTDKLFLCVMKNKEYKSKVNWSSILKKVQESCQSDDDVPKSLDDLILDALRKSPGMTVRQIVPLIPGKTKTEINSRLYTLSNKKVRKEGDSGAPKWFVI